MKKLIEIIGKISATGTPEELERLCSIHGRQWQRKFAQKELMVIQQHVMAKNRMLQGRLQAAR